MGQQNEVEEVWSWSSCIVGFVIALVLIVAMQDLHAVISSHQRRAHAVIVSNKKDFYFVDFFPEDGECVEGKCTFGKEGDSYVCETSH